VAPDDEISPERFIREHPELHHYTGVAGLQGIITSNTLWATHFGYLNDSTEVNLLKDPLKEFLIPRVLCANSQFANERSRRERRALKSGRNLHGVRCVTLSMVDSFFQAAFGAQDFQGLSEPYVTSFCAHSGSRVYERKNGLLSQWRAYGGNNSERYCIVFDTDQLARLLQKEWRSHYWIHMALDKLNYDEEDFKVDALFPRLCREFEAAVVEVIRGGMPDASKDAIIALLNAAPWFKHRGFYEEQEARIVAIPGKEGMAKEISAADPSYTPLPLKTLYGTPDLTEGRPHIALFDELHVALPIVRIIVGPSRDQQQNFEHACSLIGNRAPVHKSETPFIG
jgi:hypothetical protein